MKFIIFICTRIQHGEYPRLPDFPYNETLGKYIYQGRELTVDEFNEAAARVFDPHYRSDRYQFQPLIIDEATVAKLEADRKAKADAEARMREERLAAEAARKAAEAPAEEVPEEPVTEVETTPETVTEESEAVTAEAPAEETVTTEKFRLVENDIFMGDERVGGIYENGLRCSKGFANLRDEIEAWLNPQPQ